MAVPDRSFFDHRAHGFVRVAAAVPAIRLADPAFNGKAVADLFERAVDDGVAVTVFPELCLSGYSIDDLHQQSAVQHAVLDALADLADLTATRQGLLVVGAPLRLAGRLLNCAVVLSDGRVLGIAPKSYLPQYREFYEKRQFAAARDVPADVVRCLGQDVPIGADLVFRDEEDGDLAVHVEICEDVWTPIPPSTYAAFAGATVLVNLSASNITVGKAAYRRQLAAGQSAKTLSAYVYTAAGPGESTTDVAWDGHAMIHENGELLAESERFADTSALVTADVDVERLVQERSRFTSWTDCATDHADRVDALRSVPFARAPDGRVRPLRRAVARFPYVPASAARRDERCAEAYAIQVSGLVQRLRASGHDRVVIGVSGGLDSTQSLLVAVRAMDRMALPQTHVLAYTMPGFATSRGTLENARRLMDALGVTAGEIDIRPACERMLADIGHPYARGEPLYDVTFENVQAGQRTSHLFRLANHHRALVLGTGDLSELALGWCTYGVGDHMSHYNVNASVPKTLVQHLVRWVADREAADGGEETAAVLRDILETGISPELVPGGDEEGPAQRTEDVIGPYALHDFTLYHVTRRGYGPAKTAYLAAHAWANDLPADAVDASGRVAEADGRDGDVAARDEGLSPYALDDVLRWQRVFLERFFGTSQFKRTAVPNGPKVGSGGSLSPRGDWRAPSDAAATVWLAAWEETARWVERSRRPR